jgi:hypothetical protein
MPRLATANPIDFEWESTFCDSPLGHPAPGGSRLAWLVRVHNPAALGRPVVLP